ncbi:hypothetical protein I545_5940 [Mycobacterium kansasii 662]|uniref:Uncharacterized protein n=1 Tax=Mycobacterium kansasii 662 TaxID=1299326 RepID=X7YRI8_MYCKA|nr:hypothetical protein I545_5940 [Mycobacterium kansasii 662]
MAINALTPAAAGGRALTGRSGLPEHFRSRRSTPAGATTRMNPLVYQFLETNPS